MTKTSPPDLIVVGAGVFGLWQARHAMKRDERVLVVEKRQVGAGASGGFLGALMPHMPDTWNAKKQMQFGGLSSLAEAVSALEAETGIDCGYRRCGRLMPLKHERMLDHVYRRIEGVSRYWIDGAGRQAFEMEHVSPEDLPKRFKGPDGQPWLSEAVARFGAQYDTLSARVNPRAYLEALAASIRNHLKGDICEGAGVVGIAEDSGSVTVRLDDGETLSAARAVIANGWEAYSLLGEMDARVGGQSLTGRGVKGQAALLEQTHHDDLPIVYDDGSYVIPQGASMGADGQGLPNRIAVGASSVNDWLPGDGPADGDVLEGARTGYDQENSGFLDHARTCCPSIRKASVIEKWANIRPRNTVRNIETGKIGTEPIFGYVDGSEKISVAVGGFKISFGVGHLET